MYAYVIHHLPHPVWKDGGFGAFDDRSRGWSEIARLVCGGEMVGERRRFSEEGRAGILTARRIPAMGDAGAAAEYEAELCVVPQFSAPILRQEVASGEWAHADLPVDDMVESWEVVVSDEPVDVAAHMQDAGFHETERGVFELDRDFRDEWPKDPDCIRALDDAPLTGIWHVTDMFVRELLASEAPQGAVNPVCSPYCCDELLSIAQYGAAGATREAITKARGGSEQAVAGGSLSQSGEPRQIKEGRLERLVLRHSRNQHEQAVTMRHASGVWVGTIAEPSKDFRKRCAAEGVPVSKVDFMDPRVAGRIADFIEDGTGGMLRPQVNVGADTLACLVSTLWFKDAWKDEFEEQDTTTDAFHKADGTVVQTKFMHNTVDGMVADYADCAVASLPFKHGGRMVFVLPDKDVELDEMLRSGALTRVLRSYLCQPEDEVRRVLSGKVYFSLPRFTAETTYEGLERQLGLEGRCDMTPMTGSDNCKVIVTHGAKVMVNERGAEASAYAMMMVECLGVPSLPRPFTLDRPFAYMIVSDEGTPLFVGVVRDPTA